MKICPKCGSQFSDSEAFCENCGGALEFSAAAAPQTYAPPVQQTGYQSTGSAQTAPDSRKTLLITMVIVLSVLILALIAVMLLFIASPSKDDGKLQKAIDVDQAYVVTDTTTNTTSRNGGFNFIENTATTTLTAATVPTETTAPITETTAAKKTTVAETKKTAKKTTTTKKTKKTTTTTKKTKKTTTTTTTAVTTTEAAGNMWDIIKSSLPSDVTCTYLLSYDGHAYAFVEGEKSWEEAAEISEQLGGYLAVIEDEDEQRMIEGLADDIITLCKSEKENIWLGGYYDENAGAWKWVNGAPFTYTNWDSWNNGEETFYQPDNYSGDEFYLRFAAKDMIYEDWIANAGKWNDTANQADGSSGDAPLSSFGFIIEFDFEVVF